MSANRIRSQYKNMAVLLRRIDHIDCDYDVFVVVEESIENARYKAAFNARKFFEAKGSAVVSWEDWLNNEKTTATVLGYTNKAPRIYYKGYLDNEKQPVPTIVKIQRDREQAGREDEIIE